VLPLPERAAPPPPPPEPAPAVPEQDFREEDDR
jgi:hypothetical protein